MKTRLMMNGFGFLHRMGGGGVGGCEVLSSILRRIDCDSWTEPDDVTSRNAGDSSIVLSVLSRDRQRMRESLQRHRLPFPVMSAFRKSRWMPTPGSTGLRLVARSLTNVKSLVRRNAPVIYNMSFLLRVGNDVNTGGLYYNGLWPRRDCGLLASQRVSNDFAVTQLSSVRKSVQLALCFRGF